MQPEPCIHRREHVYVRRSVCTDRVMYLFEYIIILCARGESLFRILHGSWYRLHSSSGSCYIV